MARASNVRPPGEASCQVKYRSCVRRTPDVATCRAPGARVNPARAHARVAVRSTGPGVELPRVPARARDRQAHVPSNGDRSECGRTGVTKGLRRTSRHRAMRREIHNSARSAIPTTRIPCALPILPYVRWLRLSMGGRHRGVTDTVRSIAATDAGRVTSPDGTAGVPFDRSHPASLSAMTLHCRSGQASHSLATSERRAL